MPRQLTQAIIEEWVALIPTGKFNVRDIWNEIGIESASGKQYLRVILGRLEEKGIICANGGGGTYRKVDVQKMPINWQAADATQIIPLKWPFGLEQYASVYGKNVVIIAGAKQEGKTTFLYDFIKLNMYQHEIELFNSETGPQQMKDRFVDLGVPLDAPFKVYERYDNFADILNPNIITVIDYLDLNSEFYLAGAEIDSVFRKLGPNGLAVIGMQIPPPSVTFVKGVKKIVDRDYAYGGGSTAKRAFIYVSMSSRKLKLKHVKKPAQKNIHPENMMWSYDISDKGDFTNINRYYGDD
jgi:hypothetical protein